jgi:hypothetical protein
MFGLTANVKSPHETKSMNIPFILNELQNLIVPTPSHFRIPCSNRVGANYRLRLASIPWLNRRGMQAARYQHLPKGLDGGGILGPDIRA